MGRFAGSGISQSATEARDLRVAGVKVHSEVPDAKVSGLILFEKVFFS